MTNKQPKRQTNEQTKRQTHANIQISKQAKQTIKHKENNNKQIYMKTKPNKTKQAEVYVFFLFLSLFLTFELPPVMQKKREKR